MLPHHPPYPRLIVGAATNKYLYDSCAGLGQMVWPNFVAKTTPNYHFNAAGLVYENQSLDSKTEHLVQILGNL